ncbi:hypothetical protein AM493_12035 [Flavobacterium akiainvivens]|uniref:Outer membrane protein beta-barrel domain-containing protein n=2 Tax=Flavobacterium akiainvivens TaxID=1202724 RepID=A0A0M9VIR9_9FLAO|nr:hypothetical protein AM493_12035 [Flavobacterium akiainvivens]
MGYGQVKDSLPQKALQMAADKFPFTRLFNVEQRYVAPFNYSSKLGDGTKLPEGKVSQMHQTRVNANINFIKNRKWIFSAGLFYNYMYSETEGGGLGDTKSDLHYYATGLSLTRFSTLFGKTAIYSASVIPTGGNDGFERVTGMVSATLLLKADATTKMTLGLLGIIDPSSIVPIVPTFTYEKKLKSGWVLDIILPQRIFMKKDVFKEGRLSLGTELSTTNFYISGYNGSSKTYMFNQMELMTGVTYEHCFSKHFIGTLKTGMLYIPASRIAEINNTFDDYEFSAQPDPSFYLNVGLSYKL